MAVMAAVAAVGELMAAARKEGRKEGRKDGRKHVLKVALKIATKAVMRVVVASVASAMLKAAPKVVGRTARIARPVKAAWKRLPVMTSAATHNRVATHNHAARRNPAMMHNHAATDSHVAKAVNRVRKVAGVNAPVANAVNALTACRAMP